MATITGTSGNDQDLEQQNQPGQQPGQSQAGSTIMPSGGTSQPGGATQQFNQNQAAPQQQRQIGSGRFTNLQQYLGANKQAGQQLGQNLQKNISQKFGQAQGTAGRQLGEATEQQQQAQTQYQKGFGQYQALGGAGQIQNLNAAPQQQYNDASGNPLPVVQQQQYTFADPTGNNAAKGTLASEYQANIGSRQQAAMDLAGNQEALQQFTGLRTGTTQQEQNQQIQQKTMEARDAAEALKSQYDQRMKQLNTEAGRGGLLSEFVGSKNYGVGQRSLDAAFLQKDPNRAVDTLKQNIGAKSTDVKQTLSNVGSAEEQAGVLKTQGQQLAEQLGAQTKQNAADYVANLESRISQMEGQRGQKLDWARKQLEDFKAGKAPNQEFIDLMGLQAGQQLFNVPKELKGVEDILDVANLSKDLNLKDVTNQQDIANYAAFAKLAGLSPDEYQVAESTADLKDIEQYDDGRSIADRTKKAREDFIKNAYKQIVTSNSNWESGYKNYASQNLLDFLSGGQNVANEMITRGQDYTGNNVSRLLNYGAALDRSLLNLGHLEAGAEAWRDTDGGDIEKGLLMGNSFANPMNTVGGTLGDINRAITGPEGLVSTAISGLADAFGIGGGNDDYKGASYARNRSQGALKRALNQHLQDAGFYNYYGDDNTIKRGDMYSMGTWDGYTHYDPTQDLKQFGYGTTDLSQAGFYQPIVNPPKPVVAGLPGGSTPKLGVADPTQAPRGDISLSPMEQAIPVPAGMTRDQILQQLAASGQLNPDDNLENMPVVG